MPEAIHGDGGSSGVGLRGPARKPSALDAAEGNPGHRALNSAEPRFVEGEPKIPFGLNARARRIWREMVVILKDIPGLLSLADGPVLADFCATRADKEALEAAVKTEVQRRLKASPPEGPRAEVEAGVIARYGTQMNRLRHRENALRRELGLSPSSRSAIRVSGQPLDKPKAGALDGALFGAAGTGPRLIKQA